LDLEPDADGEAVVGDPVVETDCTTPWALVTVVVTVPFGFVTTVVVVAPLDDPDPPPEDGLEADPALEEDPAAAGWGVGGVAAPVQPIALTPLIVISPSRTGPPLYCPRSSLTGS
jgi:hypothetical protein